MILMEQMVRILIVIRENENDNAFTNNNTKVVLNILEWQGDDEIRMVGAIAVPVFPFTLAIFLLCVVSHY